MNEQYACTEIRERNGSTVTYIWHPGVIPVHIPVQQVYGLCTLPGNLVALVKEVDDERFTFPGGGSEQGETAFETLIREYAEEMQCVPEDIKILGSLEVISPDALRDIDKHNLQVRFVCTIRSIDRFIPLQDGETEKRIFVYYKDLPEYVGFIKKYSTGKVQYDMYCDYIEGKIDL